METLRFVFLDQIQDNWDNFWNGIGKWATNFDWDSFVFYLSIAILAVVLIALIIGLVLSRKNDGIFDKELGYESSTVRIFRLDTNHNSVRFFNTSGMRNVKNVTMDDFYHSFSAKDEARVKTWIDALLSGKSKSQYLQTDVSFHKEKRTSPSFLKVSKIDRASGIIHLESYLLQYGAEMRLPHGRSFSTESEFGEAIKANGTTTGLTFCFTLMPKKAVEEGLTTEEFKDSVPPDVSSRFKSALLPYVKGNQKLIQGSDNELIVANFDMLDSSQAISFALQAVDGINKALLASKKKRETVYEVRAGIVTNKDLLGDSDAILAESRRAATTAYETSSALSFYRKGSRDYSANDVVNYRSEVERIIYEKKISYSYRPVFSVDKKRVFGYLSRAVPVNTSFSSIDELKNYAIRAQDEKNLFAAVAKNVVPPFVNERELKSQKLFYPVRVGEIPLILPLFNRLKDAKDANLVFLFREDDILSSVESTPLENLIAGFKAIKGASFSVGVIIGGKTLALDQSIYSLCDFFFVDFSTGQNDADMDTKIRSQLHALVEKLLKYKVPIVASSLLSWTALELVVGSGISYISSDVFAPYDPMPKPAGEKNMAKVLAIRERK